MKHLLTLTFIALLAFTSALPSARDSDLGDPAKGAKYRSLPTLREQDALERAWIAKRHAHVPSVLKKQ